MQSTSYITALRFPLAILVVLIHSYNTVWQSIDTPALNHFARCLSRTMPSFAVPMFFCISGFLFFLNINRFNKTTYAAKLQNRLHTLLIPYLTWNVIAFGLYAAKDILSGTPIQTPFSPDIFWGCRLNGSTFTNLYGITVHSTTAPAQMPLWFVRDLMVITIGSPFIHYALYRSGKLFLLVVGIIYYTQLWPCPAGFSFEGIWFFSLGAWVAISHTDIPSLAKRYLPWTLPLALTTLGLQTFTTSHSPFITAFTGHLYVISAMLCAIFAAETHVKKHHPSGLLSKSSYFLYASHTILLLPVTTWLSSLSKEQAAGIQILCFAAGPVIATMGCIILFYLLRKCLPRHSAWLTGIPSKP